PWPGPGACCPPASRGVASPNGGGDGATAGGAGDADGWGAVCARGAASGFTSTARDRKTSTDATVAIAIVAATPSHVIGCRQRRGDTSETPWACVTDPRASIATVPRQSAHPARCPMM